VGGDSIGRCEENVYRNICLILNGYREIERERERELFGCKHRNHWKV